MLAGIEQVLTWEAVILGTVFSTSLVGRIGRRDLKGVGFARRGFGVLTGPVAASEEGVMLVFSTYDGSQRGYV